MSTSTNYEKVDMAVAVQSADVWEQVERAESYLVSCMFKEAAEMAFSVLKHMQEDELIKSREGIQVYDMMEAAGMVLVQSLKELGRAAELVSELKEVFGTVTAIPVQVLLTGACIQISEGFPLGCQRVLEEFLSKWTYMDEEHYVLIVEEECLSHGGNNDGPLVLEVDEFMEVVEVYVVNILGMVLRDIDGATSWAEKAVLPEGRRQELLRRLHSLCSPKGASFSSQGSPLPTTTPEGCVSSLTKKNLFHDSQNACNGEDMIKKPANLKLSGQVRSCFWLFRTITLKFGRLKFVISNGKVLLGCLMFLSYYVILKKQDFIKRIARERGISMKKALVDLWQLAFSYQVNPLAAVQSLPAGRSQ